MSDSEQGATVGFVSPPHWYDPAPAEFRKVCGVEVRTQQTILPVPDLDDRLESIAAPETQEALALAVRCLAASGCDLVVQVGAPFAWAGTTGEDEARARQSRLAKVAGVPVVMTGLAIIDALRALDSRHPALACSYYDAEWCDAWTGFVRACGFEPARVSTLADQGLVPQGHTPRTLGYAITDELAQETIERTAREAGRSADAIVVTGSGARTLTIAPVLEMVIGKPVIGSDTVVYWAAAQLLGLPLGHSLGALGDARAG